MAEFIAVLMVHGRRDPFFPVGNGEVRAREIPAARLQRQCCSSSTLARSRPEDKEDDRMAADESKAVVDKWVHAWNTHDAEAAITLVTDDYKRREPGAPDIDGPDAERGYMDMVFNAFPDIHIEELHRVADGELIAIHTILTGTHRGELSGIPATGATVRFEAQEVYRVSNGKIAEQFLLLDTLGLMQQLGVIGAQ